MLIRYWQWTSPPSPAVTGVPFGPLRYRAWTTGGAVIVPPIVVEGPFGTPSVFRIDLAGYRRILRDDDEIVAFLAALLASGALH